MPQTSQLDVIMQQLDALSLAELLAVRARVDALIERQSLPLGNVKIPNTAAHGSYRKFTFIHNENSDVDILAPLTTINPPITNATNRFLYSLRELRHQVVQLSESEAKEDDSLEQVIELVDEWMADESGYDEEKYSQIEAALTQNKLSV
ncbi:hypothetical protein FNW02_03240 [Komarekiella sp. 'clone 1']|uniref:Uncharacterized protein n=1 Tax=Komarekiella delphini-convector SJRDD-AB1 TaxID=2593771 RepID=A0AA40STW3_9NOST|nr:hypothetical protein [Komarekiella delphini-convector SJRDD-AB1]